MSIADELAKLEALRRSNAINEDEYVLAKAKLLHDPTPGGAGPGPSFGAQAAEAFHRLARARDDAVIGGVCGGLGKHSPLPAWVWRVLFCFGALLVGFGLIPYIVLWICMPLEPE